MCREAETAGADALWAIDHLFWPRPLLECLTVLAVAATATSRTALGSCVLQLPLRSPTAVAKQAATLQLLSDGRFVLGVGAGEHAGEFQVAGSDFHDRGRRLDQGIADLRRAWAGTGGRYRQEPVPPTIPVWVGGSSAAARHRAAALADGWVPLFVSPAEYASGLADVRNQAAELGRDPSEVTAAVVVFVRVGREGDATRQGADWLSSMYGIPPKAFGRHLVAGSAAACAARLQDYLEAGAEHVAVMVAADDAVVHFAELAGALNLAPQRFADTGAHRPERVEVLL